MSAYKSSISTNVIVTSDGNVTWLSMVIFRSSCNVNVRYFPFDEQNCSMQFASWTYDGFQLNLVKVSALLLGKLCYFLFGIFVFFFFRAIFGCLLSVVYFTADTVVNKVSK